MNKVEKYLMKQIEVKDREIKLLHRAIECNDDYKFAFYKAKRFLNVVSKKAEIKSFDSSDGTIKRYIDLGDINDYGTDQPDFNFVCDLLGINKSECCDCECDDCECDDCECSECDCEDCFEGGEDNVE